MAPPAKTKQEMAEAKPAKPATTAIVPVKSLAMLTFEEAAKSMIAQGNTADDIILDVLNANTVDDILGSSAVGLESVLGRPMTINRAELRESDFTAGLGAYVVMFVSMDDGEQLVVTSGSQKVVAQVVAMHQKGFLPYRVSSTKANKPTAEGYYPMSLCKAPVDLEGPGEQF